MVRKRQGKLGTSARRGMAGLLSAVMLLGGLPALGPKAQAADWAQEYLDQLASWGVMRGDIDGNLHSGRAITRAEFVTMVNRAYGYDRTGKTPFTDVSPGAWYADDIAIAYNMGYFSGTSATTASPDGNLTREQAALLLGRNMMLRSTAGEVLGFSDSRQFSEWSRSLIQAVAKAGVVNGYPDGTFRPQNQITRGEVASMLVQAIGTPIREPGEYQLGNVYGNVTISDGGVTLRNTVIAGDLYLTGGIGLGDILLENVTVLGKIVASGAGEANKGDNSIILRNVKAGEMVVDSIDNQFVTLRAEGDTVIGATSVRTSAYLEDATAAGLGLSYIELDGEDGTRLQLAGNLKEVVNLTPDSHIDIAQGLVQKISVDEKAKDSSMAIEGGAWVKELNLDVGVGVSGSGDIDRLNVRASGCTVSMLPDTITVRPGITAKIAGETMDSTIAAESSADPRLLAGYPVARDIAPTTANAVFSTNKRGTVYWAISALADGSVSEEDVISPPAYSTEILKSGTISAASSKTEYTAKLSGLTSDGSYYITTVMVDARGRRSPVKVAAFTTPDNTVPNFATGYPVMSRITRNSAQVTVMTTKSSRLYYALLPKGSTAPQPQDFKAASITGNLGYGSLDVVKNSTIPFTVNNVDLEEMQTYDLYLWLTDYDGAKSSGVKKLTFTTVDGTAPVIRHMDQTDAKATSVGMTFALSEPGTVYWVVVKQGAEFLRPLTGQNTVPELTDDAAKAQVESGMGAIKKGSTQAGKADTDTVLTISGLAAQATYDLYYVAKDKAGNYSASVRKVTVNTQDNQSPTVTQEFTRWNGDDTSAPLPDTNIRLVFSEGIQGVETVQGKPRYTPIKQLYDEVEQSAGTAKEEARERLASELRKHITMYEISSGSRDAVDVRPDVSTSNWVIDYRYATVTMEDGKMVITFPTTTDTTADPSALNLKSGATYYFHVEGIADTAVIPNAMGNQALPQFRTVFAQVNLNNSDTGEIQVKYQEGGQDQTKQVRLDLSFTLDPVSTGKVPDSECWDMLLWCDTPVEFELYRRLLNSKGEPIQGEDWTQVGSAPASITPTGAAGTFSGISLQRGFITAGGQTKFDPLNKLEDQYVYEYGIQFTKVGVLTKYETWSELVTMKVGIASGSARELGNLVNGGVTADKWAMAKENQEATSIGLAYAAKGSTDELVIRKQFSDSQPPSFASDYPHISPGSTVVTMDLMLDRNGTIYYVVAPKDQFIPYVGNTAINSNNDDDQTRYPDTYVPGQGILSQDNTPNLTAPDYLEIVKPNFPNSPGIKYGSKEYAGAAFTLSVEDLEPSTDNYASEYYVYFVLKGSGEVFSKVMCYQFTTTPVSTPAIGLNNDSPQVTLGTDIESVLDWALVANDSIPSFLRAPFYGSVDSAQKTAYEKTVYYTGYDGAGQGKTFTVLDALTTVSNQTTQKSVFDLYAGSAIRKQTGEYIRRTGGSYPGSEPAGFGGLATTGGNFREKQVNCTSYMKPNVQYYFLAVAHHPKGTSDGFQAQGNVHLPDSTPPELLGVSTVITGVYDSQGNNVMATEGWKTMPNAYTYSGTVTISFSEPIYQLQYVNGNRELKGIIVANKDDAANSYVSILNVLGGSLGAQMTPGVNTTQPSSDITLKFDKIHNNASLRLFNTGTISDASSNSTGKTLLLTFQTTRQLGMVGATVDPAFEYAWMST